MQKGRTCFLRIMGKRFLVEILEVGERGICTSFQGQDYPVEGMAADLEFHRDDGFTCYHTQVVLGPAKSGGQVVLERAPGGLKFYRHRNSWRVPCDADLEIKVLGQEARRRASIINISTGGVMVRTDLAMAFGAELLLSIQLAEEETIAVRGRIAHMAEIPGPENPMRFVGIRFVGVEATAQRILTRYVWSRIRQLYPKQLRALYPRGRDVQAMQ